MTPFRPMSSLAATMSLVPTPRRRLRRHTTLGAAIMLASLVSAVAARGQTTISHTEDASPVPEGMLRFRVVNAWTRSDQRFTPNGLAPLSADFSTDALGPAQLPLLAPAWAGLQTLAANPNVRLSLGRLDVGSNVRIVTTPISL